MEDLTNAWSLCHDDLTIVLEMGAVSIQAYSYLGPSKASRRFYCLHLPSPPFSRKERLLETMEMLSWVMKSNENVTPSKQP